MPDYDGDLFNPPAPVVAVRVRHPNTHSAFAETRVLLDTGADCSLLPEELARGIGLTIDHSAAYAIAGYDGTIRDTPTVVAQVIFCGKAFQGRYGITNDQIGVLGRDVLNHLRLLFDGPAANWSQV